MQAGGQVRTVPLQSLGLQDLQEVVMQLDANIETLNANVSALRSAKNRFEQSIEAVEAIGGVSKGSETMIPLNTSVYVVGELGETEKIVIEIGAGFYAEVSREYAKKYLQRRASVVTDKLQKATDATIEKQTTLEAVQ
eukprot:Polyplicarium_translucidae@DN1717_c0_g1_i2.p1